jgi:hypothetical protein
MASSLTCLACSAKHANPLQQLDSIDEAILFMRRTDTY